jgi:hypothetical protein
VLKDFHDFHLVCAQIKYLFLHRQRRHLGADARQRGSAVTVTAAAPSQRGLGSQYLYRLTVSASDNFETRKFLPTSPELAFGSKFLKKMPRALAVLC